MKPSLGDSWATVPQASTPDAISIADDDDLDVLEDTNTLPGYNIPAATADAPSHHDEQKKYQHHSGLPASSKSQLKQERTSTTSMSSAVEKRTVSPVLGGESYALVEGPELVMPVMDDIDLSVADAVMSESQASLRLRSKLQEANHLDQGLDVESSEPESGTRSGSGEELRAQLEWLDTIRNWFPRYKSQICTFLLYMAGLLFLVIFIFYVSPSPHQQSHNNELEAKRRLLLDQNKQFQSLLQLTETTTSPLPELVASTERTLKTILRHTYIITKASGNYARGLNELRFEGRDAIDLLTFLRRHTISFAGRLAAQLDQCNLRTISLHKIKLPYLDSPSAPITSLFDTGVALRTQLDTSASALAMLGRYVSSARERLMLVRGLVIMVDFNMVPESMLGWQFKMSRALLTGGTSLKEYTARAAEMGRKAVEHIAGVDCHRDNIKGKCHGYRSSSSESGDMDANARIQGDLLGLDAWYGDLVTRLSDTRTALQVLIEKTEVDAAHLN